MSMKVEVEWELTESRRWSWSVPTTVTGNLVVHPVGVPYVPQTCLNNVEQVDFMSLGRFPLPLSPKKSKIFGTYWSGFRLGPRSASRLAETRFEVSKDAVTRNVWILVWSWTDKLTKFKFIFYLLHRSASWPPCELGYQYLPTDLKLRTSNDWTQAQLLGHWRNS